MKLRDQLLFRCLAVAALLLGLFGALLIHHSFDLQFARERESLDRRSAVLVQSAEAAAVNYALQSIPLSDDLIAEIFMPLDPSATLYAPDGARLLGSMLSMPDMGMQLTNGMLQILRPVALGGHTYQLLIHSDLTALYQARASLLTAYAALYLSLLALFAAALLITARHAVQPIERLAQIAGQLADGEMTVRAESAGSAEIRALSLSFNRMADRLTGQIDRQQRFIADLTHEMKTPLTAMIGHADLIRTGRISGEDAMLAAHRIAKEGQRLNALNARLIDLILLGQDEIERTPLRISVLIGDSASALQPVAAERAIRLHADCDDALVMGDGTLLRILLSNLTDNALKSGATAVFLMGRLENNRFILSVQDDGCGMDAAALTRVTEPFYRVDKSRSRAQGGAGLGLALCAEIARLHGTQLAFRSAPGRGTTVSLTLSGKEVPPDEDT